MDESEGCFVNIILGALGIWVAWRLLIEVGNGIANFFGGIFSSIGDIVYPPWETTVIYFRNHPTQLWMYCGIIVVLLLIFIFRKELYLLSNFFPRPREYVICPYCNKSVLFFYDWTCDYCGNNQGEKRSLKKKCTRCKRKLTSFICEHCELEIMIDAD